jgi:hypothetical protein
MRRLAASALATLRILLVATPVVATLCSDVPNDVV